MKHVTEAFLIYHDTSVLRKCMHAQMFCQSNDYIPALSCNTIHALQFYVL